MLVAAGADAALPNEVIASLLSSIIMIFRDNERNDTVNYEALERFEKWNSSLFHSLPFLSSYSTSPLISKVMK